MTDEQLIEKVWNYSVIAAALVGAVLIFRILSGIYKKNGSIVRASVKYLINTSSFLFVYVVYFSFLIVVGAPHGKTREESIENLYHWVRSESIDWFLWALLITLILTIFNAIYQAKVEKIKDNRQLIVLSLLNLVIMIYGIWLGSNTSIIGLTGEINRHTY